MADDGSPQNIWPAPKFTFEVKWGDTTMSFQEVSGLDTETQAIEYRHGNAPQFLTTKMPGRAKTGNVMMKRGVVDDSQNLVKLMQALQGGSTEQKPMTIALKDETGQSTVRWELTNAWATKITVQSGDDSGAIEEAEFAFETITIHNG